MNKTKLYGILAISFFVLNVTLLIFIFLRKPHPKTPDHNGPKNQIIKTLELDKTQISKYEDLISKHQLEINKRVKIIDDNKQNLYSQFNNESNQEELFHEIAKAQTEIERIHYNHLLDIKALCRDDQLENFKKLTQEINRLFNPKHAHHPK